MTTSASRAPDWTAVAPCWRTASCTAWTWTPAAFSFSTAAPPITSSEPLMTPLRIRGCAVDTVTTPPPPPACVTTRVCCCACVGSVSLITCVPGATTLTGARARTVSGLRRRLRPDGEPNLLAPAAVWRWH
ncbi:hypothetical protein EYF80_043329 [Liparis tanakae]|uniref:Uncharacterized protein n=1 Tax=Liparis tanakae TaxID=230148 RepID=A0A4Z2FZP9_9TELE|nr:hypothetical protein EYF80_043329 [Liparis tanakae]